MARYFELTDGSSAKFWEVDVDDKTCTFRWGRIGTNGQTKAKTFKSTALAKAEANKLVDEKLGKGYVEVASAKKKGANATAKKAPAPTSSTKKAKASASASATTSTSTKKATERATAKSKSKSRSKSKSKSNAKPSAASPKVVNEIARVLAKDYSDEHVLAFASQVRAIGHAGTDDTTLKQFRKELGFDVDDAFFAFYEWALAHSKGRYKGPIEMLDESPYVPPSLGSVVRSTRSWENIKKQQPGREWLEGFVALGSWNSNYQMAIDTLGKLEDKPGRLVYWDFKGGSSWSVTHASYAQYLESILELLKKKRYFPSTKLPRDKLYDEHCDNIRSMGWVEFDEMGLDSGGDAW